MTPELVLRTHSVVNDSSFPLFLSVPGLLLVTFCGPGWDGRTMAPEGTSSQTLDTHQFCLAFRKLLIIKVKKWFLRRMFCFPSVQTCICERCFPYSSRRSLFGIVVAHWLEWKLWSETDLDLSLGSDSVLLGWLLHPHNSSSIIGDWYQHGFMDEDKMNQICKAPRTVLSPERMFCQQLINMGVAFSTELLKLNTLTWFHSILS